MPSRQALVDRIKAGLGPVSDYAALVDFLLGLLSYRDLERTVEEVWGPARCRPRRKGTAANRRSERGCLVLLGFPRRLAGLAKACSKDSVRYALTCLRVVDDDSGNYRVEATDGRKLAVARGP